MDRALAVKKNRGCSVEHANENQVAFRLSAQEPEFVPLRLKAAFPEAAMRNQLGP
jgi:hypothetical protein